MWNLQITDTTNQESWELTYPAGRNRLRIGCLKNSEISLEGIVRLHGSLELSHTGEVHIHDYGSPTGTLVNGQRVEKSRLLHEGDVLTVRDFEIRIKEPKLPTRKEEPTSQLTTAQEPQFYRQGGLFWEKNAKPSAYDPKAGDCWTWPNGGSMVILGNDRGLVSFLRHDSSNIQEIPMGAFFIAFVQTQGLRPEGRILFQMP